MHRDGGFSSYAISDYPVMQLCSKDMPINAKPRCLKVSMPQWNSGPAAWGHSPWIGFVRLSKFVGNICQQNVSTSVLTALLISIHRLTRTVGRIASWMRTLEFCTDISADVFVQASRSFLHLPGTSNRENIFFRLAGA